MWLLVMQVGPNHVILDISEIIFKLFGGETCCEDIFLAQLLALGYSDQFRLTSICLSVRSLNDDFSQTTEPNPSKPYRQKAHSIALWNYLNMTQSGIA